MLSIKEIDNYHVAKTSQHPEAFKCGVSNFADVCTQAKAYVSLVEKIKAIKKKDDAWLGDPDLCAYEDGFNECLEQLKSFLGEI